MRENMPFVSILIPTRDNRADLVACLGSLRETEYPKSKLEVVVFDNASQDGTPETVEQIFREILQEGWASLRLIRNPLNLGAFTARDEGLKHLHPACDYVLSLDDDVEVPAAAISHLVQLGSGKGIGVVGAKIVYFDDKNTIASGGGLINWWTGQYLSAAPDQAGDCDYVTTCGCLFNRRALREVAGFDRDYFISHGDVDVCVRIKRTGFRVIYDPAVVIPHKVARGGTRTPTRLYYLYRNKILFLRKNLFYPKVAILIHLVFWLPKIMMDSVRRRRLPTCRETAAITHGMWDGLLNRRGETSRTL